MTTMIRDTSAQDRVLEPVRFTRKLPKLVPLVAVVLVFLGYFAYEFSSVFGGDRVLNRDNLRLATVRSGDLVRDIVSQGRVVAADSPTLYAMDSGTIDLRIKAGDEVEQGQVLAEIISPALNEELQREQSNLQRLQIELEGARIQSERRKLELQQREEMAEVNLKAMDREQRRAEAAFEMQIISKLDYEEATDNLARARLEYRQAQQNNALENESLDFEQNALGLSLESQQMVVEALKRRVEELTIVSPVDGMVGSLQVDPRQAVVANQPLITVVDLNNFELEARVSESYADELSPGMPVEVQVGGEYYQAELAAVSPQVINGEVIARIKFGQDKPGNLRQNQRMNARIQLQKIENTLAVSNGAFFDNFRGDAFVLEGNRVNRVPVELGGRSLSEVEILSGLEEGDTIIVSGLDYSAEEHSFVVSN